MKIDKSEIREIAFQINNKESFNKAIDYVYHAAMKDGMDIIHELLDLDNKTIEEIFKVKYPNNHYIDIIKKYYTISDINDKIEKYKSKIYTFNQFDEIYSTTKEKRGIVTKVSTGEGILIDILFEDYSTETSYFRKNKLGKITDNNDIYRLTGKHYKSIKEFIDTIEENSNEN